MQNVNIIVRGEGEETIRKLMDAIESKKPLRNVKGITFRKSNAILSTENKLFIKNIDEIPFPSFDLLPTRKHQVQGVRHSAMISDRSPENMLEKIKIPYEKHKVRNIGLIERYFHLKSEKSRENLRFNNK